MEDIEYSRLVQMAMDLAGGGAGAGGGTGGGSTAYCSDAGFGLLLCSMVL